jgi:hypothetical protein
MVLNSCQSKTTNSRAMIAYSSLPKIGAKPLICVPSAARTCCDVSDTKSSMLVMISLSKVSRSSNLQNPIKISNPACYDCLGK